MEVPWEALSAVGAIATPLVVLVLGFVLTRRQARNEELLKARIDYYRVLVPKLNQLMCYMTFIGTWRDLSPVQVVQLKRELDHEFHCAVPLFSEPVALAYETYMDACFRTFNDWGSDPRILSSAYRRRQAWRPAEGWDPGWDRMFTMADHEAIPAPTLMSLRKQYDDLVGAMVRDLDLTRTRDQYTSGQVVLNAHAPVREDIEGSPARQGHPFASPHPMTDPHPVSNERRIE